MKRRDFMFGAAAVLAGGCTSVAVKWMYDHGYKYAFIEDSVD